MYSLHIATQDGVRWITSYQEPTNHTPGYLARIRSRTEAGKSLVSACSGVEAELSPRCLMVRVQLSCFFLPSANLNQSILAKFMGS